MDIYFTPYKVSTITCTVDLGINIDLVILYNNFNIEGKSNFIWIHYPKIVDSENKRGFYPKKREMLKIQLKNLHLIIK